MTAASPCPVIDALVEAMNAHDEERAAACFSSGATVRDGGLEYHGLPAIRRWMRDAFEKYDLHLEITDVAGHGQNWTFVARVSGSFEGSPVQLEHSVAIENGRMVNLEI